MAELERILESLEGGDMDVDVVAAEVERAAFLVGLCRRRIVEARMKVEKVVAELDPGDL